MTRLTLTLLAVALVADTAVSQTPVQLRWELISDTVAGGYPTSQAYPQPVLTRMASRIFSPDFLGSPAKPGSGKPGRTLL